MSSSKPLIAAVLALAATTVTLNAQNPSLTAQSIQVSTPLLSGAAYQIGGDGTWAYDGNGANDVSLVDQYFTTTVTSTTSTLPNDAQVRAEKHQVAVANKCNFWNGDPLEGGFRSHPSGWSITITPKAPGQYAPRTGWTLESGEGGEGGSSVDVVVEGFIAGESYVRKGTAKKFDDKYSFTLSNPDGSIRVTDLTIDLFADVEGTLVHLDSKSTTPTLEVGQDWVYFANAGVFGNDAVKSSLHYEGGLPAALVSNILLQDNFKGNNKVATDAIRAKFDAVSFNIAEAGDYIVVVSGVVKGNEGAADIPFVVESDFVSVNDCDN